MIKKEFLSVCSGNGFVEKRLRRMIPLYIMLPTVTHFFFLVIV